jgi:hypothetical protein
MTDAVALEFEAPTGEKLRFEWNADELATIDSSAPSPEPIWRLGGELDWDQVEAVRVVSVSLDDGRLVAIAALRPAGAAGHGEELIAGAIGGADSFEQLEQTLLSTEYGPHGEPRRIGLELYASEEGLALRIAGDVTAVATFPAGGIERTAATLVVRGAGASGSGSLDLLRRA